MNKITVDIAGMHCKSCEILIEDELKKISCVRKADVNHNKGRAIIYYEGRMNMDNVAIAVENAGYALGKDNKNWFSNNQNDYLELGLIGSVIFIIWALGYINGWFKFDIKGLNNYGSLPIVFLIGITAGISTCMALIGGLVLGAAARFSEKHPTATAFQKFKPHLFFNLGRILSFLFFGALIGYLGSFFKLSSGMLGFLIIVVGIVMFFLGLQLVNISPKLTGMTFTLPKSLGNLLGIKRQNEKEYSHRNSFVLGALTFFLPCGFTQAMQLFAMSTGNPISGALTMGVFALGTAPGLLSIGGLTSIVKGAFARIFFRTAGVVVVGLAIVNLNSGFNLSGLKNISLPKINLETSANEVTSPSQAAQTIQATYNVSEGFQPKTLTVKSGAPVQLEISAQDNGSGCMGSITIPGLVSNVEVFRAGQKIIFNFTAPKPGEYQITCAMGIPHGTIIAQ